MLIDDYPATVARLESAGYALPLTMSHDRLVDVAYADMRAQLGHYVEYIRLGDEGRAWFASVPGFPGLP